MPDKNAGPGRRSAMPLMDEFREERESIKNQPFKKKLEYFWTYYKWWVIGGIFLIIVLVTVIIQIATNKKDALYIAMVDIINTPGASEELTITTPFLEEHGINPKKNTINFNTDFLFTDPSGGDKTGASPSYSDTQGFTGRESLAIYIAAGDVDAICGSDEWFDTYAYNNFFLPLNEYLTDEEIDKYSDSIYYIDGAVLSRYTQARSDQDYEYEEAFPDSDEPEKMEQPLAVGIILDDSGLYNSNFVCANGDAKHIVIGIVRNSPETPLAADFVKYIRDGN